MMFTRMDFIFWKGRPDMFNFFSLALINDKFLYENECEALIYTEKQRFGPVFS